MDEELTLYFSSYADDVNVLEDLAKQVKDSTQVRSLMEGSIDGMLRSKLQLSKEVVFKMGFTYGWHIARATLREKKIMVKAALESSETLH